jgi:hypothetical protein
MFVTTTFLKLFRAFPSCARRSFHRAMAVDSAPPGISGPIYHWQEGVETLERYRIGGYHPIRLGDDFSWRTVSGNSQTRIWQIFHGLAGQGSRRGSICFSEIHYSSRLRVEFRSKRLGTIYVKAISVILVASLSCLYWMTFGLKDQMAGISV